MNAEETDHYLFMIEARLKAGRGITRPEITALREILRVARSGVCESNMDAAKAKPDSEAVLELCDSYHYYWKRTDIGGSCPYCLKAGNAFLKSQ